jgi:hypothetical protein
LSVDEHTPSPSGSRQTGSDVVVDELVDDVVVEDVVGTVVEVDVVVLVAGSITRSDVGMDAAAGPGRFELALTTALKVNGTHGRLTKSAFPATPIGSGPAGDPPSAIDVASVPAFEQTPLVPQSVLITQPWPAFVPALQ